MSQRVDRTTDEDNEEEYEGVDNAPRHSSLLENISGDWGVSATRLGGRNKRSSATDDIIEGGEGIDIPSALPAILRKDNAHKRQRNSISQLKEFLSRRSARTGDKS